MNYRPYFCFLLLCFDLQAQIPVAQLVIENEPITVMKSELANLVLLELMSPTDAQLLGTFFELGGAVQNVYQLQGLIEQELSAFPQILPFIKAQSALVMPGNHAAQFFQYDGRLQLPQLLWNDDSTYFYKDTLQLGPSFAFQQRIKINWRTWQGGFQFAKDVAEPLWHQSPKIGIDFTSGFLAWTAPNKRQFIQKMVLGAYQVQSGQGLQLWSSRGLGKSIDLLQLARNPIGIKPYQGRDEQRFLQGAAFSFQLRKHTLTCISSVKNIDARPPQDTLLNEFNFTFSNGLHRTQTEISKRKQALEQIYGLGYTHRTGLLQFGTLLLYHNVQFTKDYKDTFLTSESLNAHAFWSAGVYAQSTWRQFYFYGEAVAAFGQGLSVKSATAINVAFVYYLDQNLEIGMHLRQYGPHYRALYANPIANATPGANERAFIFQLKWQVQKKTIVKYSSEHWVVPHLILAPKFPRSVYENRILLHHTVSKQRSFDSQIAIHSISNKQHQMRIMARGQLQLNKNESLRVSIQTSKLSNLSGIGKQFEFSWTHAPLGAKLHFETIYGLYQVPIGAATIYTNTHLLGFGAQTIQLNGIGTYTLAAIKYSSVTDWKFTLASSFRRSFLIGAPTKFTLSIVVQKKF